MVEQQKKNYVSQIVDSWPVLQPGTPDGWDGTIPWVVQKLDRSC